MSRSATVDHLPPGHVQHILLMLLVLAVPHLPRMPLWLAALILAAGTWRLLAARQTWSMPPAWLRNLLTLLTFGGIFLEYQTLNGHAPGVALLLGMLAMKLTEMTRRRDYLLVIYLSYFVLITHFLFNQDIVNAPLLLLGALAVTMVLIEVNHPQGPMPLPVLGRMAGTLLLQAIPLMVVFFLLFPRIPGPLWGLPSSQDQGLTGLDNSMEPGGISNLSLSDEVAFRVRFDGPLPPAEKLYWRGPVFEDFNGRAWQPNDNADFPREIGARLLSDPVSYEMQLEPHGHKWILALDLPTTPRPADTDLGPDLVLRNSYDINSKMLFALSSVLDYQAEIELPAYVRRRNLRVPEAINPRARALAQRWQQQYGTPDGIVQAALQHFREQEFAYTLQPPPLYRSDLVDEFLFETRRGFCEHYASAFTFLMRVAGVPTRVVTGYQGAEPNGDYYIIRQSDAHAWSEVWFEGRGWVRVDPTAAVAPERIELGLGRSLPRGEPIPGLARPGRDLLARLQLGWDRIDEAWNRWFLAYGPELQKNFLERLGLPDLRAMLIALTAGTVLVLIAVGLWTGQRLRSLSSRDPVLRQWQRFQRKLRRAGLASPPSEGPADLARRLAQHRPEWAEAGRQISRLYIQLRYARARPDPLLLQQLRRRITQFPGIDR